MLRPWDTVKIESSLGFPSYPSRHDYIKTSNIMNESVGYAQHTANVNLITTMIQAIHQQRCNPDLMDFDRDTFTKLSAIIKDRQMQVSQYADRGSEGRLGEKNFLHSIFQLELDRIGFLLKSYLRIRLGKIQRYALYIVKNPQCLTDLSPEQQKFVKAYAKMRFQEYDQLVLKDLHKDFRGLDGVENIFGKPADKKKDMSSKQTKVQVVQPNKNKFVFFKVLDNPKQMRYNHEVYISNVRRQETPLIEINDVLFVPYSEIQPLFKNKCGQLL